MHANPENIAVEDLIAHRGRMKLIAEVVEFDTERAVTRSIAAGSWPLAGDDGVNPLILVELVAQTAGVCNGWNRIRKEGIEADARGWLVGIKQADFFVDRIALGTPIIAEARNDFEFEGFREVKGEAVIAGKVAARVILQVVQARENQ